MTNDNTKDLTMKNVPSNSKKAVIDRIFTQVGFDQFLLDDSHTLKPPHLKSIKANAPLVLHVDDDQDLVDAVTSRFSANGYRVASALDGISGVQAALLHPADVVILDYDMPNGRGDIVIELLKGNEKTADIPIVVLTAVHKIGLKRQLLSKGADVFMTKPFEFVELQSVVDALIDPAE